MWSDANRLFYIEGALTVFVALVAAFVLPDFPSTSHHWLSTIEVRLAEKRMEEDTGVHDGGQTEVKGQGQVLLDALTDWKVIYMALKYLVFHAPRLHLTYLLHEALPVSSPPSRSMRSSLPSPLHLGTTELLPSYFALRLGLSQLWSRSPSRGRSSPYSRVDNRLTQDCRHSDATGERSFHMIISLCVGLVGFVIAFSTMNIAARYFSL